MIKLVKITLAAALLISAWGSAPALTRAQPAQQPAADDPNLLKNPGFESPYVKQCCQTDPKYLPNTLIDEVQVATNWRGWWLDPRYPDFPPTCDGCTAWHRPEWREAAPYSNRIRSGANAQKYFTFFSVHRAGMYQQVNNIGTGQKLRFSIYMHAWSGNGPSLTSITKDNDMGMKVGLDPLGGTDPFNSRIVWSTPFNTYDVWALYSVEAVAQNSTVTVFTYSQPRWGLEHNDIYLDDASLVVTDGSAAPSPSATPAPTTTPSVPTQTAPTAVPATPVPTATLAPTFITYTVQRGDSLYSIARKFTTTAAKLQSFNGILNAARIFVGQVIKIPTGTTTAAPPAASSTAPTSPPPAGSNQVTTYVIQRGDRMVYIARKFNTPLNALLAVNPGLDPNKIFAGQVINIPPTQATRSYVVQSGDTLRKIADKFGASVAAIQALNSISNINTIFVGQTLLIP